MTLAEWEVHKTMLSVDEKEYGNIVASLQALRQLELRLVLVDDCPKAAVVSISD